MLSLLRASPLRFAMNKSTGYRWSPIPHPPPKGYDRLYGTHSVLNTLRVFATTEPPAVKVDHTNEKNTRTQKDEKTSIELGKGYHPNRGNINCLYVRDFSIEDSFKQTAHKAAPGENGGKKKMMKVVPSQYTSLHQIIGLSKYIGVPVKFVPRKELVNLCGERRNQNCVLEVQSYHTRRINSVMGVESILSALASATDTRAEKTMEHDHIDTNNKNSDCSPVKTILYLDHVVDPTNVGNLIRTCFFYNINDIILSKDCSACTPVVARASTGFLEYMNVYQSSVPTVEFLRNSIAQTQNIQKNKANSDSDSSPTIDLRLIASSAHEQKENAEENMDIADAAVVLNSASSNNSPHNHSTATSSSNVIVNVLLLGNEFEGIDRATMEQCHYTLHLSSPRQEALARAQQRRSVSPPATTSGEDETSKDTERGRADNLTFEEKQALQRKRLSRLKPKEVTLNVNTACAAILTQLLNNTLKVRRVTPQRTAPSSTTTARKESELEEDLTE